jgi:hypothetical protein
MQLHCGRQCMKFGLFPSTNINGKSRLARVLAGGSTNGYALPYLYDCLEGLTCPQRDYSR